MFADKGLGRCMPGGRGRRTLPRAISPLSKKNRIPRNENTKPRPVSTTPISAPGAHPFSGLLRSGIHTARARHPSVTSAVAPRDRTPSIVQHPAPKMSLHRRQAPSCVPQARECSQPSGCGPRTLQVAALAGSAWQHYALKRFAELARPHRQSSADTRPWCVCLVR